MRNFHPESWSAQARELGDKAINNVNSGYWSEEQAKRFFNLSYRAPLIRYRAAKRYCRAVRTGKVQESLVAFLRWEAYKAERALPQVEAIHGGYLEY